MIIFISIPCEGQAKKPCRLGCRRPEELCATQRRGCRGWCLARGRAQAKGAERSVPFLKTGHGELESLYWPYNSWFDMVLLKVWLAFGKSRFHSMLFHVLIVYIYIILVSFGSCLVHKISRTWLRLSVSWFNIYSIAEIVEDVWRHAIIAQLTMNRLASLCTIFSEFCQIWVHFRISTNKFCPIPIYKVFFSSTKSGWVPLPQLRPFKKKPFPNRERLSMRPLANPTLDNEPWLACNHQLAVWPLQVYL